MNNEIIDRIKKDFTINELNLEKDVERPWGGYITYARNTECTTKLLIIENELSIQAHEHRDEIWHLVQGNAVVYRGKIFEDTDRTIANLRPTIVSHGDLIYIPKTIVHTAVNLGQSPALFVEISLGKALEEDIKRFYDKHGRTENSRYPKELNTKDLISFCRNKLRN